MTQLPAAIDQAFAYAHGRIGVLQQSLLDRSDMDRLLGTHDDAEASHVLTELKLTNRISQALSGGEEILDALTRWIRDEVLHMAPEEKTDVFDILWLENDGPLLAYLLKRKRGLTSAISTEPVSVLSALDIRELKELIDTAQAKHPPSLPESLIAFVQEILATETLTPSGIDTAVAQWIADRQTRLAKESKSLGIRQFVAHRIDTANIRTVLRTMDLPADKRQAALLRGGSIPVSQLLGNRKEVAHAIEQADLGFGLAAFVRTGNDDVNTLERALADVLAADIALLWNVPLSVEPLFAFAALALSQIRLLRVLLMGKRSGLSPQEIKKILPPFIPATHYVL